MTKLTKLDYIKFIAGVVFAVWVITGIGLYLLYPRDYLPSLIASMYFAFALCGSVAFVGGMAMLVATRRFSKKIGIVIIAGLLISVPSLTYIIGDIQSARQKHVQFEHDIAELETEISRVCVETIASSSTPIQRPEQVKPRERIWLFIENQFENQFVLGGREALRKMERAAWQSQVRAVAYVRQSYQETGKAYTPDMILYIGEGIKAVVIYWEVYLVDIEGRSITAHTVLKGPDPPNRIYGEAVTGDVYGVTPVKEYHAWLASLPSLQTNMKK